MADDDFQFKWTLTNPFEYLLSVESSFSLTYPDATRWIVKLLPLTRNYNSQIILCSLKYDNISRPAEPTAERLEIVVSLNNVHVNRNLLFNYPFSGETRYLYSFEVDIEGSDLREINNLKILIQINIRSEGIVEAVAERNYLGWQLEGRLFYGDADDMTNLTEALENCRQNGPFFTMRIINFRDQRETCVHHFILKGRWPNFFRINDLDENSDFVMTAIPYELVNDILKYMYTGEVETNRERWGEILYVTEFFQVIFQYQIFHLYEILRQSGVNVSQNTINYVDKKRISIVLHYVTDTLLKRQSMTYLVYVCPSADSGLHTFQFSVHIRHKNRAGPWLSYSVLSQTGIPFNVQVNLEIPDNRGLTRLVYSNDYNIPGNGRVESGPILFLGCPETFFGHYPEDNAIHKKLLFGLTFHQEASSVSIWLLRNNKEFMRSADEVLSQHMRDILTQQFKADLTVKSIFHNRNGSTVHYPIHKAIFINRVPEWWNVVQPNLLADAELPDTVLLSLRKESYELVESYIYTGKMFYIPLSLRGEILDFANNSRFTSLASLVRSMSYQQIYYL